MKASAKRLMVAFIVVGLGLALYGMQTDAIAAVVFGLAIAMIGGAVGRIQREDDTAGH